VYTAARQTSRTLAVVGALLLFADYTVTASLSVLDAFHYFGLPLHRQVDPAERRVFSESQATKRAVPVADGHFNADFRGALRTDIFAS
jgi:hypothetical protein